MVTTSLKTENLENDRVCEKDFASRRAAKAGRNLILTGFQHCSWDTKTLQIEQTIKKAARKEATERGSMNWRPRTKNRLSPVSMCRALALKEMKAMNKEQK